MVKIAVPKPMTHRDVQNLPIHVLQDAGEHANKYQQPFTALPVLLMSYLHEPFCEILCIQIQMQNYTLTGEYSY